MAQTNPIYFGYYSTADVLTDMTAYLDEQNFTVNQADEYQTWTDANWTDHQEHVRTRISGEAVLGFADEATYRAFLAAFRGARRTNGTIRLKAYVNNLDTVADFYAFVAITGAGKWDRQNSRQWQTIALTIRER